MIREVRGFASKTFFAQMGCVYLLSSRVLGEHSQSEGAITQDLRSHLRKILTTDSRVISVEYFPTDEKSEGWDIYSQTLPAEAFVEDGKESIRGTFRLQHAFVSPFLAELKLEARAKEKRRFWQEFPLYQKMDKCHVWYNGAIFMAYTDDPKALFSGFGQAVRDVLQEIFEPSELVNAEVVGPSPMHPDIEIILFSREKAKEVLSDFGLKALVPQATMDGSKFVVSLPVDEDRLQNRLDETLLAVYYEISEHLMGFYQAQTTRVVALRREEMLLKEFDNLRVATGRLHSVKTWHLLERLRATHNLGMSISTTTLSLVDAQQAYRDLSGATEKVRQSARDSRVASCLTDYLVAQTQELPIIDPESLVTLLERLDSEVGRYSLSQAQLLSAVVGGIVGALLTLLVGWLTHMFGT